jgi:hypothetical protein
LDKRYYIDYVVSALNTGVNGTGTGLIAMDISVTTPGTGSAGAMRVDMADDIDGDGSPDANVVGTPDQTFGQPTPTFGSNLGTFLGLPSSASGKIVSGSFPLVLSPEDYETTIGTLDPAFSHLHSLQVISLGGVLDNSSPVPFANIVVPTGTTFDLSGYLGGDLGLPQWIDVSNGVLTTTIQTAAIDGEESTPRSHCRSRRISAF